MKKSFTRFKIMFLLVLFCGIQLNTAIAQNSEEGIKDGVVRIKLAPGLERALSITKSANMLSTGITELDRTSRKYSATDMKRVFPYSPKFDERHRKHGLHLWYEISYSAGTNPQAVAHNYKELGEIEHAEPVYIHKVAKSEPVYVDKASGRSADLPFNDEYLNEQWHYNNVGQSGGTPGADINLFKAWETITGSSNIIVSIHDTGVEHDHEDLTDAMWVNEAELHGDPNVDDDGNGFKDDIYGFNFADNIGEITPHYHGTHVAGTVGAISNNGMGVAGVAGGSGNSDGVKIMSLQILGGVSQGNTPASYVYAADNGAVISQNSWGYFSPNYREQAVLDAIDYFIEEAGNYPGSPMRGGIVFFASGNHGWDNEFYPAYYENVIAVSATDHNNVKAGYSNYGDWIEISAPGGDYYIPDEEGGGEIGGEPTELFSSGIMSTLDNNRYGTIDGTSMACPHVSGVAALAVAKFGGQNFTNEDLVTRLLSSYTNIDTVPGNEMYIGKLGTGLIDAALALAVDNQIAPEKVTDLTVQSLAQDFAIIDWTVPSDSDDEKPSTFEIFYSKDPIVEGNLAFARSIRIENKKVAGEKTTYEITNLDALTKYYFAVRSTDRWGNTSEFSNEVTGTTNSGPVASVDKSTLVEKINQSGWPPVFDTIYHEPIFIDTKADVNGSGNFTLLNEGEGLLRWDMETRHVDFQQAWSRNFPNYASETEANYADANVAGQGVIIPNSRQGFVQEYITQYYSHVNLWESKWIIGETDTSFTNSSATRFYVDNPDGFNLNQVNTLLNFKPGKGAVKMEVYRGENISDAQILYQQDIEDSSYPYENYVYMNEEIYFPQGTSFWIVFHVPSGNLFPLGAGLELTPESSKNCFMSLDMGKSWALFEDLYYNNLLAWYVLPTSTKTHGGEYITLSPSTGEVASMSNTEITAGVDATALINGTYKSNLVINTNDTENPMLRVPVEITVSGQEPVLETEAIVEFGSVLLGNSKTAEVTIKNSGFGKFSNPSISISNPDFISKAQWLPTFEAQNETTLEFEFTPTKVGNSTAVVTLSNWNGQSHTFNLFGVGAEPPLMVLAPDTASFNDLTMGDSISGSFAIKNAGNYPLHYYIPGFASGENVGEIDKYTHKYGYVENANLGGVNPEPAFMWEDMADAEDITEFFRDKSNGLFMLQDIGFEFPFFGKGETQLYIVRDGMISFDQNSNFNSQPYEFKDRHDYLPTRYIAPFSNFFDFTNNGTIKLKKFIDKFVVEYETYNDWWSDFPVQKVHFQVVLHDNGNINFYYNEITGLGMGEWSPLSTMLVAIEDKNLQDGLHINDFKRFDKYTISNNTAIEIVNPGLGLLTDVTNPFGTVQIGDSVTIDYTMSTEKLYVGDFVEKFTIISNDPANNPGIFSVDINIASGGVAEMSVTDSVLNFGQVFQGDTKTLNLNVINSGAAISNVESAIASNGNFTIEGVLPVEVKPKRIIEYKVNINTSTLGSVEDTLTITTSTQDTFIVLINGEIVEAPSISTNLGVVNDTLKYGQTKEHTLAISNNGGNTLEYNLTAPEWLTFNKVENKAAKIPEYTYYYKTSNDAGGPVYNWTDIVETGTFLVPDGEEEFFDPNTARDVYVPIELPWTFNFYGNDYDTLYFGYYGFLSFDFIDFVPFLGQAHPFPSNGDMNRPNNVIAPLWATGYPALWWEETAGRYYKVENDRIIFQWEHMVDIFGMANPISYQAIIYKNGNIKFQYNFKGESNPQIINLGVVGVENEDGTEGVQISYNQAFVQDGMAILLNPAVKQTIQAGETVNYDVIVDASRNYGGTYTGNINILNNAPANPELTIPATLTIVGDSDIDYPELIDMGDIMISTEEDEYGWVKAKTYYEEFEVKNNGTNSLTINSFAINPRTEAQVEIYKFETSPWGGSYWTWVNVDWIWEPITITPGESLKLRAGVAPSGNFSEVRDTFVMNTDLPEGQLKVGIHANPSHPPVIGFDVEGIDVYVDSANVQMDTSIIIDNYAGIYDLAYQMELEFVRDIENGGNEEVAFARTNDNAQAPQLVKSTMQSINTKSAKSANNYNRVLDYPITEGDFKSVGYGGALPFTAATYFKAPADGFNLTHVQTYFVPFERLSTEIKVTILAGSEQIHHAREIHSQTFYHELLFEDYDGDFIDIELTKNLEFYPNEPFFVLFSYPTAAHFPQGIGKVEEKVYERYYYGTDLESWFDITSQDEFQDNGWLVKVMEQNYLSKQWLNVLSPMNDTIVSSDSARIDLAINAIPSEKGINKAFLVIKSNDPNNPTKKVPINLHRNDGPQFDLGKSVEFTITETEILDIDIVVSDVEGDDFTVALKEAYDNVEANLTDEIVNFKYTSDYNSAGFHQFVVVGTDSYENEKTITVNVNVLNRNRVPEPGDTDIVKMRVTDGYKLIDASSFIFDMDNDAIEWKIDIADTTRVDVFSSASAFIFDAKEIGVTTVTITGTDPYGETATKTITVYIDGPTSTGIFEDGDYNVYPNPTTGKVYISVPTTDGEVKISVINTVGQVVKTEIYQNNGVPINVDLTGHVEGVYIFKIVGDNTESKVQIIKL